MQFQFPSLDALNSKELEEMHTSFTAEICKTQSELDQIGETDPTSDLADDFRRSMAETLLGDMKRILGRIDEASEQLS